MNIPICTACGDYIVLCVDCEKSWAECEFTQCSPCATATETNLSEDGTYLISTHAPVTDEPPHFIHLDEYIRAGHC